MANRRRPQHTYTDAQQAALELPCRLATQALDFRLGHDVAPGVTLQLSINTGYE